jgi:hypothetical protein
MNVEVFYDICSSKIRSMFLILQSYSLVYTQVAVDCHELQKIWQIYLAPEETMD